jgi:exodeoxyribonuclease VII small subunit
MVRLNQTIMAKKKQKFEDLIAEVESTLEKLEGGEIPLEDALKQYEGGVAAIRKCFDILKQAEKTVLKLSERGDELAEEPFDEEDNGDDEDDSAKGKLF